MAKKRSDGNYCTRVTVGHDINGKAIRKAFYSRKSLKDAKEKAKQWMIDQQVSARTDGASAFRSRTDFETLARTVLTLKKEKIKQNTWELNWRHVIENYLVPYFGQADVSLIKRIDIERYFISHADLTHATLKKHLSCLQEIFRQAEDNDYTQKNPVANFRLEVGQDSVSKDSYSAEEAEMVLRFAKSHRFGLDIILLLQYGLSVSELLGLEFADVNYEKATITVCRGVTRVDGGLLISGTKNKYRNRTIPLAADTLELISARQSESKGAVNIISNRRGAVCRPDTWRNRHYSVFMAEMQQYYESECNVHIKILNPHELRHTRASLWVADDINLFAIAEAMGWADLDMLRKRYAHADIDAIREQLKLK